MGAEQRLNLRKQDEVERQARVQEAQGAEQLKNTRFYYDTQAKYYDALRAGKTMEAQQYFNQLALFEKYNGVTLDQIPAIDQMRMFGQVIAGPGAQTSGDTTYTVPTPYGDVGMTGGQVATYTAAMAGRAETEAKNDLAEQYNIIKAEDDFLVDPENNKARAKYVNSQNNPYYLLSDRIVIKGLGNDIRPGRYQLAIDPETGKQITMDEIRIEAEKAGISIDTYIKTHPRLLVTE